MSAPRSVDPSPALPASAAVHASTTPGSAPPWWRVGPMWLVVGGPLLVVVASFVTLALAIVYPDPVLVTATPLGGSGERPAVEARNHAAQPPAR